MQALELDLDYNKKEKNMKKYIILFLFLIVFSDCDNSSLPFSKGKKKDNTFLIALAALGSSIAGSNGTTNDYKPTIKSIEVLDSAFSSFNTKCYNNAGAVMEIEKQTKNSNGVIDSKKSCSNISAPSSSCYQVAEVSSCAAINKDYTSTEKLAAYWKGIDAKGEGRSVLFCYTDKTCPENVFGNSATYIKRAMTALDAWQIGLAKDNFGKTRDLTSIFDPNPRNWITVTGDDCIGEGVPSSMQGGNCVFAISSIIVGVCGTSFLSNGSIFISTTIMRKSFQDNTNIPESFKLNVITHELGHCLGLQHAVIASRIMYPSVTGLSSPSSDEINAVKSVYTPVGEPSIAIKNEFFNQSIESTARRHYTFPVFTMDAKMGYSNSQTKSVLTKKFTGCLCSY